jgi:hypothetical protein
MLNLWYAALATDHGVVIHTDGDFERVRQKLYAARRERNDPELKHLSICQSPTEPGDLWIVKRGRAMAQMFKPLPPRPELEELFRQRCDSLSPKRTAPLMLMRQRDEDRRKEDSKH